MMLDNLECRSVVGNCTLRRRLFALRIVWVTQLRQYPLGFEGQSLRYLDDSVSMRRREV